jgi:hypothetical protein
MFQMMNEARIGVSLGAAGVGYRAFRQSLGYAGERIQGKGTEGGGNVPILSHPDVQRMLAEQKYYCEAALAMTLYAARLADSGDRDMLDLLTPIVKSWTSSFTLRANDQAIQIHGGYGYTRDFDVELLWRDNRLNPIHEGTNGIQAIDLLERKLLRGGSALERLRGHIDETAARARRDEGLAPLAGSLLAAWADVERAIDGARAAGLRQRLFGASALLDAIGHVVAGWLLLDQLADRSIAGDDPYLDGKRRSCALFYAIEFPKLAAWLSIVGHEDIHHLANMAHEF